MRTNEVSVTNRTNLNVAPIAELRSVQAKLQGMARQYRASGKTVEAQDAADRASAVETTIWYRETYGSPCY